MKKTIALLAALLLTLPLIAACGSTGTGDGTTAGAQTGAQTAAPAASAEGTTGKKYADDLPEDLNFGGEAVTFLYREEIADEFYTDLDNGEYVNDALNASILSVEDRLNADIVCIKKEGHLMAARDAYMDAITNTAKSGDHVWDWVDLMIGNSPVLAAEGIFVNLLDVNYLDLEQPWYIPDIEDTAAVNGRLFFVSGDASLGYLKCAYCIFYNKDMTTSLRLDDPAALAESGGWTMDKLMEYAAAGGSDLDGDGKYNESDILGFVNHDNNHPKGYIGALATPLFTKNASGEWEFTYGGERDQLAAEKINKLKTATPGAYFYNGNNASSSSLQGYNTLSNLFCSDKIMMISAEMDDLVSQYRAMASEHGVLPFPKLDTEQENYYTLSRSTHNAFSMPVTCAERDRACAVYEALGASNYQTVFPVYYELALKTKYSPDVESARLFDLIHNTMTLDFGYIFANAISTNPVTVYTNSTNNVATFASFVKANAKMVSAALEKYLDKMEQNCGQ